MRKTGLFMKTMAAVLGMSVLFQATALAEPLDELTELIEKQEELSEEHKSLLDQYVDFSGIGEAMDENGLQVQVNGDVVIEGIKASLSTGIQSEKDARKWLLELGLDLQDTDVLDLGLYADSEMLALSVPQFLAKEPAIRSGDFAQQVNGSALSELFGIPQLPQLELSFVPGGEPSDTENAFSDFADSLEEQAGEFAEKVLVEKTEDGDIINYTMTYMTEDILNLYRSVIDEYLAVFEAMGIPVTMNGSGDVEAEIDRQIDVIRNLLDDEVAVDYRVKDGLIEGLHYEMELDLAAAQQAAQQDAASLEDGVTVDGADEAVSSFPRHFVFDLSYTDPANPGHGFTFRNAPQDESGTELGTIDIVFTCENDGTMETHTYTLNLSAEEESLSRTLYTSVFDSSTGKFTVEAALPEDLESGSANAIELKLDSTLSEVEKGRSFLWTVDELYGAAGGESGSISGSLRVSADPQTIAEPQNPQMIFEMTQEEISALATEVMINVQSWSESMNSLFGGDETADTEVPAVG